MSIRWDAMLRALPQAIEQARKENLDREDPIFDGETIAQRAAKLASEYADAFVKEYTRIFKP